MFLVIPARPPQCYGGWTNAGIHEIRHVIDSGSPLRYGRNDVFNCRVNSIRYCVEAGRNIQKIVYTASYNTECGQAQFRRTFIISAHDCNKTGSTTNDLTGNRAQHPLRKASTDG